MTPSPFTSILIALVSAGFLQTVWEVYKYFKGGEKRRARVEEARLEMAASDDKDKAPLVIESMRLGNFERAVAIQMQIINRQETSLERQDQKIQRLESEVESREARIEELETQMRRCNAHIEELEHEVARLEQGA